MNGTQNNCTIDSNFLKVGLGECKLEASIKGNWYKMCLYGSIEMYMGNLNIQLVEEEPDYTYIDRTDYFSPTIDDLTKAGGYIFDYNENNYIEMTNSKNAIISLLPEDIKNNMTIEKGFSDNAIYVKSISNSSVDYINSFNGLFNQLYDYTISFNSYETTNTGSLVLLMMREYDGFQNSRYDITKTNVSDSIYNYTIIFNPIENYDKFLLYNV